DIQSNLWELFGDISERQGGTHAGRVGVVLSDIAAVEPDQVIYLRPREECLINDAYFHGPPDLVAEVMSPASRAFARGPRSDLYRRHDVPHLWLLDPELEMLEVYELVGSQYQLSATYRPGEQFHPTLFPEETVVVEDLFESQWKRHREETLN